MSVNEHMQKKVPNGLCRKGDKAVYKDKDYVIVEDGLPNEHGYLLNIRLKPVKKGRKIVVSAHENGLMIYPPNEEVPGKLLEFCEDNDLVVVRVPNNGDEMRYAPHCPECEMNVWLSTTCSEAADFQWDKGFYNTKLEITDSTRHLTCQCMKNIDLPEDYEVSY